jgi:hypothetical protein
MFLLLNFHYLISQRGSLELCELTAAVIIERKLKDFGVVIKGFVSGNTLTPGRLGSLLHQI